MKSAGESTSAFLDPDEGFAPREESYHVRGQRIAVERRGSGNPLLLINGIGATGELFLPFRQAIFDLDQRETIAFDAPGVGNSPAPIVPMTMCQLAGLIDSMIARMGYSQVDVLGLSWGGALAQELAIRHPKRVGKLVLTATNHGWTSVPGRPAALGILMTPARYYSPEYLQRVAPTLYGGLIRTQPELLAEHARIRAERPPSPTGYVYQMLAISAWSSLARLPFVRTPTLIMVGNDDPIIPAVNGRTMARFLPNSELEIIDDGGHLFLFTRPEEMARRVLRFLDQD